MSGGVSPSFNLHSAIIILYLALYSTYVDKYSIRAVLMLLLCVQVYHMLTVYSIVHCANTFWVSSAACHPDVHLHEGSQLVEHALSQLAAG